MFGRNNVEKAIREGNLGRLRKIVNKNPDLLQKRLQWKVPGNDYFGGNIVEMAAYYNKPDLINFLVTEKGVKIDTAVQEGWTALHTASRFNRQESVETLLNLGADAKLKTHRGYTAYGLSKDSRVQDLLRPAYEEQKKEEEQKAQAIKQQRKQEELAENTAKAEGTWELSPGSTVEVVHQYEAPVGQYQITDIFNFAAERLVSITKDLDSGQVTPLRQAFKDVSALEIAQAKAKLDALNSGINTDAAAESKAASQRQDAYKYPTASL